MLAAGRSMCKVPVVAVSLGCPKARERARKARIPWREKVMRDETQRQVGARSDGTVAVNPGNNIE